MTETETAAKWNAESDIYNQWSELGTDEKVAHAYACGVAAERARIRAKLEELYGLALEGHMPFGDTYFEGAKDYIDLALTIIDADKPNTDGEY